MRPDPKPEPREDPRYPIGEFSFPQSTTAAERRLWIAEIAEAPALGVIRLDRNLALYAWHGKHHVAHIASVRERGSGG